MRWLIVGLAVISVSCGIRGKRLDTTALVAELGIDGAAEALRIRIADEPGDVGARRALAAIEDRRRRPGAVIEQLEIVAAIGGPFGARLDDGERTRLAALYRERAKVRAARRSPDGLADLERARELAGAAGEDAAVRTETTVALAIAELRNTDPDQRAAGARRLAALDSDDAEIAAIARALADPDGAAVAELGIAGAALWDLRARRAAHDLLVVWARRGGDDAAPAAQLDAWLAARSWWGGTGARPDLATLRQAIAAGASPCHFAEQLGDHGCGASAGDAAVARARRRGWRTADPDEAAAWVAATADAWARGSIPSWLDELDARVDLAALDAARLPVTIPAWARAPLLRAAGRAEDARLALDRAEAEGAGARIVELERALAGEPPASDAPADASAAVVLAAATGSRWVALEEVARAFRNDPASADRVAEDVAARDVDRARAAARVAELFGVLGDPARARAWWERAVAAGPLDAGYRAGLVRGLAAAGDGPAARVAVITAAARSGDAGATMLAGARAMADAGLIIDALVPAKQALELTAPGEQQEVLALVIELEAALGRDHQVATLTAALEAQQASRDVTTLRARARAGDPAALATAAASDPTDATLAILAAAGDDDDAAAARLRRAAAWHPSDVAIRVALLDRAPGDADALDDLARLARDAPTRTQRVTAARAWVSASRAGASSR